MLTIDIWSDLVCPFCWIGKRHLDTALAQLGQELGPVQVNWRPFQLDPQASLAPVPLREAYAEKFGGPERSQQLLAQTQAQANAVGLPMDFSQGQVKVSTLPAHRLMQLAAAEGDPRAVAEALFAAHFAHGHNLADIEVLARAGAAGSLAPERVRQWMDDGEGLAQLQAELAQGQALGISSVPTFVINDRYGIQGAQPPESLLQALRQIAAQAVATLPEQGGDACGGQGCAL
jgi:predicted DsbA family dithiol-disulfide isomerase